LLLSLSTITFNLVKFKKTIKMKTNPKKPLPTSNVSIEEQKNTIGGIKNKLFAAALAAASEWEMGGGGGGGVSAGASPAYNLWNSVNIDFGYIEESFRNYIESTQPIRDALQWFWRVATTDTEDPRNYDGIIYMKKDSLWVE